jgi:hypothetical protein
MQELNIVELIEKNPISKLSNAYNNKLINKIKDNFNDFESQLFVSSFYCYLNYDKNIDFVVDLDDVWKWLGFQQKYHAKTVLEKHFRMDIDYKTALATSGAVSEQEPTVKQNGGHNKQTILLTIKCFKSLCLKAQTKKAGEIHEYYMKMEEVLHQIVEEETDELRLQLEQKENIILEIKQSSEQEKDKLLQNSKKEKQKAVEKAIIVQFPLNTECIYFGTIDNTNEAQEKLIKFGHTNDLATRILDHRKKYTNFILVEAFRVQNKVEIENLIKTYPKIKRQIRTLELNGKNKTEIIAYDATNFTIDKLTKHIKDIIHSKTYSIDNFNKLLQQNEDLLKENELLKSQLKTHNETIIKQTIELNDLNNKVKNQDTKLQVFELENKSVYQNPLLNDDEQTNKFNEFIETMCIVRHDVEESTVNMEGQYRIWNKTKPKKEVFHALKHYLDTRFKPSRLSIQDKNQVINGYLGVKLKPIEYRKKLVGDNVETFLFQVCRFSPNGKMLNSTLLKEYQRWKISLNKECLESDMIELKSYLNSCEYALKSTVWTDEGSNEGYYGISLKTNEHKHKMPSSTGKKVEKVEEKTGLVIGTWETIAKAAEAELVSPAKMSRSIKTQTIFNNDYFYRTMQ